jgi:hypothetical protein
MPDETTKPVATIVRAAAALQAMAEAEFAAWLAQQPDEVRAMTEAEQVEIWADSTP